ncbi:hypothetical protein [Mobilicoccus sp.]|uniref:hypothetical protein n=1 Tax=Mobilicoccus sp. TaxID=2034349 RepID=UPI00289C8A78|nr:hypothetical protein [Mobilicoccus sp.]
MAVMPSTAADPRSPVAGRLSPRAPWPWRPTWPQGSLIPPLVQIDHVLAHGFAVADEEIVHVPAPTTPG